MKLIHEGDPDKLAYGWWCSQHGIIKLPRTLGDKRNFVLTHEELCHYELTLLKLKLQLDNEHANVLATIKALRSGKAQIRYSTDREPVCYTFAHILQFQIYIAKAKLESLNLLNYILQMRKNERSPGNPDESASGPAA